MQYFTEFRACGDSLYRELRWAVNALTHMSVIAGIIPKFAEKYEVDGHAGVVVRMILGTRTIVKVDTGRSY